MKKYFLLPIVGIALISCRLDDNLTPNKVLADNVLPTLRLAGASTDAYKVQAGTMNGLGNAWMNTWSGNFASFGNPFTVESNLEVSTTYRATLFQDTYKTVTRFQRIIDESTKFPNYAAVAKIQKAYYMQYIVDLYGNVPYSEAFKEFDNVNPKYDKDVDVYKGLVAELLEAKSLIAANSANPAFKIESTSDPIFKGNLVKWNEFANTVLLKYAVHLANTSNAEGIALRNQIITALAGAQFISGDVSINPGYSNASADAQNPLYNNFGLQTYSGSENTNGYRLMTASDHAIKTLQGDPTKITNGISDARIAYVFTTGKKYNKTAGGGAVGYYGFPQGMTNDDYKVFLGYTVDDPKPSINNFSFLGGIFATTGSGALTNGYLMLKSESELLQAEAALRGYGGFAGDQAHFEQGIKNSFVFDYTQVNPAATVAANADAASYITAISSNPKVGWVGTTEDKIAAIQYQRWVALINYNGIESYINYLRTGYPVTPLATKTVRSNKPYRMLYPASEYSSNTANVPNLTLAQIFEKNEFTPFIYK